MLHRSLRAHTLLRHLLRRAAGIDLDAFTAQWKDLRFRLTALGDRLDGIDQRLLDICSQLGMQLDIPEPPTALTDLVGGSDSFASAGNVMFEFLKTMAHLEPSEYLLDVGCGVGRTARHLTTYLASDARYCGFDVVADSIRWCQTHISRAYPNFHFAHANIFNGLYNPTGTLRATEFAFPYEGEAFDLVFLDSVFTHMYPADVGHYLGEIRRVLKAGGRCLMSFFLLDPQAIASMQRNPGRLNFRFKGGEGFRTVSPECPESAIAFELKTMHKLVEHDAGLKIRNILNGNWSGRSDPNAGDQQQDLVLAFK